MCKKMLEKFDKYWSEYSVVLAFGAILNPRFKYHMLEYFYSQVESESTKVLEKMTLVKSKFYNTKTSDSSSSNLQSQSSQSSLSPLFGSSKSAKSKKFLDGMSTFETQTITKAGKAGKSQLDINVLEFWKNQRHRFTDLALMACDILAIPITTVASKSSFSIGGRVLTKYRSSMIPENFQALIFTRNWLYGFQSNDGDNQDDKIFEETHSTAFNPLEIDEDESEQEGDGCDIDHDDFMEDEF